MLSFEEFTEFCVKFTGFIAGKLSEPSEDFPHSHKSDGTEVTPFDFLIEDELRNSITSLFPEHGILGEEREPWNPEAVFKWILDPIDGTFGFTKGVPLFGTLIGFLEKNEPKYGFLRMPMIANSWISGNGTLALMDGKPIVTKPHFSWKRSLVLTTDQQTIENSPIAKFWEKAIASGGTARTWGDCFGYYMLCVGKAELMADTGLKPYDIMPLIPILRGAGLEVHQVGCSDYTNVLACKPGVFEQLK
ncbi:MAG: inositol monophosphatase family protein [Opitutae bacterium]